MLYRLLIISIVIAVGEASANQIEGAFFDRSSEGYFWYEDPIPEQKNKTPDDKKTKKEATETKSKDIPQYLLTPSGRDPLDELEEYRKTFDRAKALAVLYPTKENVERYQYLNMANLNRASLFSDIWRRNVWSNPELDYQQKRPSTFLAKLEYDNQERKKIEEAIRDAAENNGLFFFFRSTCPYCHKFAPILKQLEKEYGIKVLPISLDGQGLPDYPEPKHDITVAKRLGVTTVPTLYVVNPKKRSQILVTNRLISLSELKQRIYILTKTRPGETY